MSFHYGWFPYNHVQSSCQISKIKNLKLGKNVWIGKHGMLRCGRGISIGDNTIIAECVYMITDNHNYNSDRMIPFDDIYYSYKIDIGPNCWIGAKVTICPGVKIEEGVVIGAGSVVTKSVPKCAIVGGSPAKIIGWRDIELYDKLVNQKAFYKPEPIKYINVDEFKEYMKG